MIIWKMSLIDTEGVPTKTGNTIHRESVKGLSFLTSKKNLASENELARQRGRYDV